MIFEDTVLDEIVDLLVEDIDQDLKVQSVILCREIVLQIRFKFPSFIDKIVKHVLSGIRTMLKLGHFLENLYKNYVSNFSSGICLVEMLKFNQYFVVNVLHFELWLVVIFFE